MSNLNFVCPICGYDKLKTPPYIEGVGQFDICPCCFFEYGYDDGNSGETFDSWRQKWLFENGGKWMSEEDKPQKWSKEELIEQLKNLKKCNYLRVKQKNGFELTFTIDEYIREIIGGKLTQK